MNPRAALRTSWPVILSHALFAAWGLACLLLSIVLPSTTAWNVFATELPRSPFVLGLCCSLVAGHLLGALLGLSRIRLGVAGLLFAGLFLGASAAGLSLGPVGYFALPFVFAMVGGYSGIASHYDFLAAWYPLSLSLTAVAVRLNSIGAAATLHTTEKHLVWDVFSAVFLAGSVFLMLLFLATRHALGLVRWQQVGRRFWKEEPEAQAAEIDRARPGRGSVLALLAFSALIFTSTAVLSPYLFRTVIVERGTSVDTPPPHPSHDHTGNGSSSATGSSGNGSTENASAGNAGSSASGTGNELPFGSNPSGSNTGAYATNSNGDYAGSSNGSATGAGFSLSGDNAGQGSFSASQNGTAPSQGSSMNLHGSSSQSGSAASQHTTRPSSRHSRHSRHSSSSTSASSARSSHQAAPPSDTPSFSNHTTTQPSVSAPSTAPRGTETPQTSTTATPPAQTRSPETQAPHHTSTTPIASIEAALQTLGKLLLVLLLVLLSFGLLVLLFAKPLRRWLLLKHLENPLWKVAPTTRVMNLWQRLLLALQDVGIAPFESETPVLFAARAAEELRSQHQCSPSGLEEAALLIEKLQYAGRGLGAGEEDTMRTAVLKFVRVLSEHTSLWNKCKSVWKPVPLQEDWA